MDKDKDKDTKTTTEASAGSVPTEAEIEAAAERLGPNWLSSAPRPHAAGTSQIVQSLAHGRGHAVAVEIKRPPRRLTNPR